MYIVNCHKCGQPGRLAKGRAEYGRIYQCFMLCPSDDWIKKLYPPEVNQDDIDKLLAGDKIETS